MQNRARKIFRDVFRFLPVQLFLLHFRKYQLFLLFWIVLVLVITGDFAAIFGASTLFLAPEYLGETNFRSMFLLGGAMAVFVMAWHITTFIINHTRIPFIGAVRYAFIKYCLNNSLLPLLFLIFYTITSIRFQLFHEQAGILQVLRIQAGFYLGFTLIIIISFAYFFRVGRDLLKTVIGRIANPALIRNIIPYDSLDIEMDLLKADTFLTGRLKIRKFSDVESYHPRLLNTVLRKHSRNATTATLFAILVLFLLGLFSEQPTLRVPAAASFLLLFSVIMGMVGSVKYFLRSWEILGWAMIISIVAFLVKERVVDLRSIAYGLDYKAEQPEYNYNALRAVFNKKRFYMDRDAEQHRLDNWKNNVADSGAKPPLVIISVSGGGSRAAFWTFRSLQYADSLSGGRLFSHTAMFTGASGGAMGAAYWRGLHDMYRDSIIDNPYKAEYQRNIAKDLLNSIVFSLASVDLISPFNKISLAGYSYTKDRGYAMEQEMIRNTDGVLDKSISDYMQKEGEGKIPMAIINGTILNDGRRLMIASQPVGYLTQSEYDLSHETYSAIDGVDFATFFHNNNPYNLRLTAALRMTATFPYVLPVVKLPSTPNINIMDAGLRDNFGMELASRYVHVFRKWIKENTSRVIIVQIRDTRQHEVFPPSEMNTLGKMLSDPLFAIHNKWEPFQSYNQGYIKDYLEEYMGDNLEYVTLQYIPEEGKKSAPLNFHVTAKEQEDLLKSIYHKENTKQLQKLLRLLATD
jgi:hypothetical protein